MPRESPKRLTLRQAADRLGVSRSLVQHWIKNGCRYLNGEKLTQFDPPNGSRKGVTVDGAQVEIIRLARKVTKPSRSRRTKFVSYQEQWKRFKFSRSCLYNWTQNGCCYLEGKRLECDVEKRKSANNSIREIEVYRLSQLEEIDERMKEEEKGFYRDHEGTWLTAKAARRDYKLWGSHFHTWRKKGTPLLNGDRLRAKRFRRLNRRGIHQTKHCYFEDQLREIDAALNSPPDGVYRESQGEWYYAEKVAELTGWPADNLWYRRRQTYPYLPDGRLLAKKIPGISHPNPANRKRNLWGYFAPHVRAIVAHKSGRPDEAPTDLSPKLAAENGRSKKSGKGRPKGRVDQEVQDRKEAMIREFKAGKFGNNKSKAARAHGFHESDGRRYLAGIIPTQT